MNNALNKYISILNDNMENKKTVCLKLSLDEAIEIVSNALYNVKNKKMHIDATVPATKLKNLVIRPNSQSSDAMTVKYHLAIVEDSLCLAFMPDFPKRTGNVKMIFLSFNNFKYNDVFNNISDTYKKFIYYNK